jgi:hybrid cluster-associated redox disulfide protein
MVVPWESVMAEAEFEDEDVDAIMTRWPVTIRVFLTHGMHCVGCPIGGFHSLADAAEAHGMDHDQLTREIAAAIAGAGPKAAPDVRRRR